MVRRGKRGGGGISFIGHFILNWGSSIGNIGIGICRISGGITRVADQELMAQGKTAPEMRMTTNDEGGP
jgi:hypothetical protein